MDGALLRRRSKDLEVRFVSRVDRSGMERKIAGIGVSRHARHGIGMTYVGRERQAAFNPIGAVSGH